MDLHLSLARARLLDREIIPFPFCYLRPGYLDYPTNQNNDDSRMMSSLPSTIHLQDDADSDDEDFEDTEPDDGLVPFVEGAFADLTPMFVVVPSSGKSSRSSRWFATSHCHLDRVQGCERGAFCKSRTHLRERR